jgi:hypothetical protein
LRDKGIKGTVSPYTTLEVDGADNNFFQTAYIPDGGENPRWNQSFHVECHRVPKLVKVTVYSKNNVLKDYFVGRGEIDMRDAVATGDIVKWVDLWPKTGSFVCGSVEMHIVWKAGGGSSTAAIPSPPSVQQGYPMQTAHAPTQQYPNPASHMSHNPFAASHWGAPAQPPPPPTGTYQPQPPVSLPTAQQAQFAPQPPTYPPQFVQQQFQPQPPSGVPPQHHPPVAAAHQPPVASAARMRSLPPTPLHERDIERIRQAELGRVLSQSTDEVRVQLATFAELAWLEQTQQGETVVDICIQATMLFSCQYVYPCRLRFFFLLSGSTVH